MKKALRNILLLALVIFLIRGGLFRFLVKYHATDMLPKQEITNQAFLQFIEKQEVEPTIEAIVKKSLRLSANRLSFTTHRCDIDPNLLFTSQKTNCIGYAAFFKTTCDGLLRKAKLESRFRVKHLRGKLTLLGIDLHRMSDSPFFRDHDFNLVEDMQTGEKIFVDASTFDMLGIGIVSGK